MPAVGGFYYRDHLPHLTVDFKKSQSGFTTGDKVCVQQLTKEKLQELTVGHGGWNADMEKVSLLVDMPLLLLLIPAKEGEIVININYNMKKTWFAKVK